MHGLTSESTVICFCDLLSKRKSELSFEGASSQQKQRVVEIGKVNLKVSCVSIALGCFSGLVAGKAQCQITFELEGSTAAL